MNRDDNGLVLIIVLVAVFWFMTQQKKSEAATPNNISNAEVWKWTDYKGQDRSITITRDVHVS